MIKKILISFILLILLIPSSLYAADETSSIAKNWFYTYSKKISIKYNIPKQILFFNGFNDKLNELLAKKKFNESQVNLINDLIKLANEYIFKLELNEKEKNNKSSLESNNLLKDFKYFSYNPDHIFLENGVWYAYLFDKHLVFPSGKPITIEDLKFNNISTSNAIVFLKEDNNLGFIVNYKKIKLISDSIIYGIPDKYNFLKEVKDDKKTLNSDTDELFKKLKEDTLSLTKGKVKSLKIKAIYNFVLNNVEYPKTFSLADAKIFSGIDTFKNKSGVCEGYTKIFMYMLNFANINNSQVIRGYVIDAQDFPQIGHAWVKIGNEYFDPTFDDPIGNTKTKIYEQYYYYSLPKDLFYTNRFDFNDIIENIKEKDMDSRKAIISQNIAPLLQKYKNSGYNILKPYFIKLNNGIKIDKKLDIEDLKKILGYYEVIDLKFTQNGAIKTITNYNYYQVDNSIVSELLDQIRYELNGYYLFKWKLDNGSYEYRLAYDVIVK